MIRPHAIPGILLTLVIVTSSPAPWAARISDIANTAHNLSASGPGPVKAVSESQICVFCHTPHAAENLPDAPLWNRKASGATYTPYTSNSINAADITATPGGSSKLCLSCHDGTLAIGAVNVANGQLDVTIGMTGTGPAGTIPEGAGALTGFTRDLGINLTNDHPISFTYDSALATTDGELRDPALEDHIGNRSPGVRPVIPLQNGKLECSSCHDPHIRDSDMNLDIKFLRLNRLQTGPPGGGAFSEINDQVCLGCHDKMGQAWALSAHADTSVAAEIYKDAAASTREFPNGTRVWEAACLNCHDSHTVQGARRLLREATDSLAAPKSGGDSAIEEGCYQCHTTPAESVLLNATQVPNIETDFLLARHMPIRAVDQQAGSEIHDVTDANGTETQLLLGKGNLNNRHAECTDCHNPHRVLKNRAFNGTGSTVAGTHDHSGGHSNVASGALRGARGLEPLYGSASFHALPSSYQVKAGDGGIGAGTAVINPYVTREYQICLKCHSDFGYNDNNNYPTGNRPDLGDSGGGTPSGTNGLTQYTNQAREFQAPVFHKGEVTTTDSGAASGFSSNNHRSWHPVIADTGRSAAIRNMSASTNLFLSPWNGTNIGSQTMYCSDCHGSTTSPGTVVPAGGEDGNPWGPHGSTNDFILKGSWNSTSGSTNDGVCFRCHSHTNYATEQNEGGGAGFASGFGGDKDSNLHAFHAKQVGRNLRCMWCHTAVPHGWKNKALLVNLNDVGPEAGLPAGTEISIGSNGAVYNQEPYYRNAKLKVITFAPSGQWRDSDCGSASGQQGTGGDWMKNVCENPP
jgi:hypothetical protein